MASTTRRISPTSSDGAQQKYWDYNSSPLTHSPTMGYNIRGAIQRSGTDELHERGVSTKALTNLETTVQRLQAEQNEAWAAKKMLYDLKNNNPSGGIDKRQVSSLTHSPKSTMDQNIHCAIERSGTDELHERGASMIALTNLEKTIQRLQAEQNEAWAAQKMLCDLKKNKSSGGIDKRQVSSLTHSPTSTMDYSINCAIERSGTDELHERGASMKAMTLREKTIQPLHRATKPAGVKTARQAAEEKFQAEQKEKRAVKKILYDLKKNSPTAGIVKKLVVDKPLETMATSTRRVDKFAKAMEDPESVEKEKCTLERQKENDAKLRALQMVDFIHESGKEGFQII